MWLVIKWWRSLWLVQLTHLGCLKKLDCDTQWNKKCFFVCLRHLCCSSFWRTGIPQITTIPTLSDDGAVRVPFKAISFWNVLNHCNSCVWIRYIIATFCFLSTLRSTEVIPHHRSSGRFGPHCGHHSDGTRCGWVQQQGGDGWLPSMYRSSRYHLAKFSCDALLCTYLFSYDILSNMLFVLGLKLKINFP